MGMGARLHIEKEKEGNASHSLVSIMILLRPRKHYITLMPPSFY